MASEHVRTNIRGLPALLVVVTLALGLIYLAVIPPWGGPDEPRHFEYVRLLYDKGRLVSWADVNPKVEREIIRSLDAVNYWKFGQSIWKRSQPGELPKNFGAIWGEGAHELHQPPLAYLLYLVPFSLVPNAPLTTQLYAMRLLSILLNAVVVLAAFVAGRELWYGHSAAVPQSGAVPQQDTTLALALPLFVMLLPQHLFMHSTVNNDHLAEAALAWIFALLARSFRLGLSLGRGLVILALVAIGLAAKRNALVALPILAFAFVVYGIVHWGRGRLTPQQKSIRLAGTAVGLSAAVILGVWTWNYVKTALPDLYDYIVRLFLFLPTEQFPFTPDARILSPTALPLYGDYVKKMFISTWGHYGWMNITLGVQAYWFFAVLCVLGAAGLVLFVVRDFGSLVAEQRATLVVFAASAIMMIVFIIASQVRLWDLRWGGDPQGRYLFPVLIPLATLLLIGWRAFVPKRWHPAWFGTLVVAMILYNLIALFGFIIPFYRA